MHKYTSTRVPAHSGIPTLTPSQWTALPACQILSPKPWTPGSPLSLALSITSSLCLLSEDLPGSPFTAISTATTSRRPGPSMPNSCINPSLLSPPFVHFSNPFPSCRWVSLPEMQIRSNLSQAQKLSISSSRSQEKSSFLPFLPPHPHGQHCHSDHLRHRHHHHQ